MDARTVARIAGVKVGTLNAWVHRGLIPGMTIGASGRRRAIDTETAIRIAIFAEMVRFGIPPDDAAFAVTSMTRTTGWWLVPAPAQHVGTEARLIAHGVPSLDVVGEELQNLQTVGDAAVIYALINVGMLAERVRQAEQEWEQSRRAKT